MKMNVIDKIWEDLYGHVSPIADELKNIFPDRWVRFHSLPESKRYPESDAELLEILKRHNTILDYIFLSHEPLVILEIAWSNETKAALLIQGASHWQDVSVDPDNEDWVWHIYQRTMPWSIGVLDDAIKSSANYEIVNFMAIGSHSKVLYHPYDGGLDLIMPSTEKRNQIKGRFSEYLSNHPRGL